MDSSMNVRPATEMEVRWVLLNPEFFPFISDGIAPIDVTVDMSEVWMLFYEGNEIVGLFNFHKITRICWEMHPMVFKKFRLKYARDCIKWAFRWFMGHKLIVRIPENRPELLNFAKKSGFVREGINRESLMQNGAIINIIHLGITKDEINSYLEAA